MPEILTFGTAQDASDELARRICNTVKTNPRAVLGLATGGTMEPVYAGVIRRFRAGGMTFADVSSFNLDEYAGLDPEDPESHALTYRGTMQTLLFDHVDIDPSATHLPNGMAPDLETEAARYDARIKDAGGVDLQLLGLGGNGHIGFNEPGSAVDSRTRVVDLTEETRKANARFFGSRQVPHQALTMGIGTILEARRIAILVTGGAKAAAVQAALEGPVSPACPASALQLHPDVTWLLDAEAASALRETVLTA